MSTRYVYIVKGTEIDIVGVWSSEKEGVEAAIQHVKDSGVINYRVERVNDFYTSIIPTKYETCEKAEVMRYILQ